MRIIYHLLPILLILYTTTSCTFQKKISRVIQADCEIKWIEVIVSKKRLKAVQQIHYKLKSRKKEKLDIIMASAMEAGNSVDFCCKNNICTLEIALGERYLETRDEYTSFPLSTIELVVSIGDKRCLIGVSMSSTR